jgi:DNA-3-methyladenine glycosylase
VRRMTLVQQLRCPGAAGGFAAARIVAVVPSPLPAAFFARPAATVARDLLGCLLLRRHEGRERVVRVVETEAYLGVPDRASHAWAGRRTARTETLYLPPGHIYVYLIYGLHHCLNVTTGGEPGAAVLFRAGEPVAGEEEMGRSRGLAGPGREGALTGGPGKLCQALAIDRALNAGRFEGPELELRADVAVGEEAIARGPRVGVDYAGEAARWPLRFAVRGNPHVSRPRFG